MGQKPENPEPETPKVDGEVPPQPDPDAPAEESDEGSIIEGSETWVRRMRKENQRYRQQLRDAEARLKSLEGVESKLKEIEDAEKSELEKLQEQVAAAEQEKVTALERANSQLVRAAVIAEAASQGAVDPDVIVALVDRGEIEVDESGEVAGHQEAVAQLLEAKPFLRKSGSPAGPGGGGIRESKDSSLSAEQVRDLAKSDPAKFNELFESGQIPASALGASGSRMP